MKKKNELKTLEEIEEYFSKARKIYTDKQYHNYKDLIEDMISGKINTYYKNGKLHCSRGRFRSISDIVVICKNYFNTSFKDVLSELDKSDNGRGYCNVVRKYVFHHYTQAFRNNDYWKNRFTEIGNMYYNDLIKLCQ